MKLQINGESRDLEGAANIAELIAALGLPAPAVLVERTMATALRRDEWPQRTLAEGDCLEIIRIVAGG